MSTELRMIPRLVALATVIAAALPASISYSQGAIGGDVGLMGGYGGYGSSPRNVIKEVKALAEIEVKLESVLEILPRALPEEDVEFERQMLIKFYDRLSAKVEGKTIPSQESQSNTGHGSKVETHVNLAAPEQTASSSDGARYQITSWSHAAGSGGSAMHGAYIIDSKTGRIWVVINDNAPREIGALELSR